MNMSNEGEKMDKANKNDLAGIIEVTTVFLNDEANEWIDDGWELLAVGTGPINVHEGGGVSVCYVLGRRA